MPASQTKCYGGALHFNPSMELTQPWCELTSCDDQIIDAAYNIGAHVLPPYVIAGTIFTLWSGGAYQ